MRSKFYCGGLKVSVVSIGYSEHNDDADEIDENDVEDENCYRTARAMSPSSSLE
jgi:hypothetical protein